MKARCATMALSSVLILFSCTNLYADMISDKIAENLLAIESYTGVVVERGVLPDAPDTRLVRQVVYQKSWKFRTEVLEPASMKGTLFIYDGRVVTMWWPQQLFGIRMVGASPPSDSQVRQIIKRDYHRSTKNYAFSYLGQRRVAKRMATRFKVYPTRRQPYLFRHESLSDSRYSLPLKLTIYDKPKHVWYAMEFTEITFGVTTAPDAFTFEFPKNAVVFEWDLAGKHHPLDEVQQRMNFDILVPTKLPAKHKIRKVIRGKHCLPMITLLLDRAGRWLSLTETRKTGILEQTSIGIPIQIGQHPGFLSFNGTFATVSWSQGNTALVLIGNLPYPELIAIAASVKRRPAK